jgi:hypothetical protein
LAFYFKLTSVFADRVAASKVGVLGAGSSFFISQKEKGILVLIKITKFCKKNLTIGINVPILFEHCSCSAADFEFLRVAEEKSPEKIFRSI